MNSIADGSVIVQTSSQSVPSTPPWFGEVALIAQHLRRHDILSAICEHVRFVRRRFGHYDVIDFVAVLFGYAISGERTLEAFYKRLHPFAPASMALFGRERLPARSTLSRFLASRTLYDCPDVPMGSAGQRCRVVVATHPVTEKKSRIGLTRSDLVYELFFTRLPQDAFTAADVVALYLHRGAFEPTLADEDQEQDPDRWCSHSPCGQEAWQIVCQWVWNLRLELGHQLDPTSMRTTEFAPAAPEAEEQQVPSSGYGPPTIAAPWKADRLSGRDFVLQPDGTLSCPANQSLSATEQRREADGSLRLVYAAKMSQCRPCLLREPRRVSLLLHPLWVGPAPLLWKDWSRRQHRRACMCLLRNQRVEVTLRQAMPSEPQDPEVILSRAQRAHYRLSWEERLARNACALTVGQITITLFGVPASFATFLGLSTQM